MDAATLQIKAKWFMSHPVRTVRPDATLSAVMLAMSEHGGPCMPVVDELAKVLGIDFLA
jgi:CBS domain-containing protein